MSRCVNDYNFPCPSVSEALTMYCCKLRAQVQELTQECERLNTEIKRMKGEDTGKLYKMDQTQIKILKGDLW